MNIVVIHVFASLQIRDWTQGFTDMLPKFKSARVRSKNCDVVNNQVDQSRSEDNTQSQLLRAKIYLHK